jgi:selenocysteine lyase/cysteine desulfurase
MNTTHALNTVIKGILRDGDHVLISDIEHNAVYRPIYKLASEGRISFDIYPSMIGDPRRNPTRICAGIAKLLRPNTRMVISAFSSNICSAVMPINEIGSFCRRHGIFFLVDGAQGAGHIPLDLGKAEIDALCLPSHKGLMGIQGAGAVILDKEITLDTLLEGGSGVNSLDGEMPSFSPERYEAGTLPTPALAALCEGVRWISERGIEDISEHERALYRYLRERLCNMNGIKVYASEYEGAVLLFSIDGMTSERVVNMLDGYGICSRGGFHCCPLGHKTLNTQDDGAVRISFGAFNTECQAERFTDAMRLLIKK